MKCHQAEEWMDQVLDGTADGVRTHALLDEHVSACPQCRRQWDLLQMAEAALRVPKPVPAPEGMLLDLRRRLAEERPLIEPAPLGRRFWPWLFPAGALTGAAAALGLIVAFGLWPRGETRLAQAPPRSEVRAAPAPVETPPAAAPRNPDPGLPLKLSPAAGEARSRLSTVPGPPSLADEPRAGAPGAAGELPRLSKAAPPATSTLDLFTRPDAELPERERIAGKRDTAEAESAVRSNESRVAAKGVPNSQYFNQSPAGIGPVGAAQNYAANQSAPALAGGAQGGIGGGFGGGLGGFGGGAAGPGAGADAQKSKVADNGPGLAYRQQLFGYVSADAEVSPALLTALNREVEIRLKEGTVQEAVERLAEQADVPVRVDPRAQQLRVSVQEESAPLWQALETVALQNSLQILPEENRLVLKPAAPAAAERSLRLVRPEAATIAGKPAAAPGAPDATRARGALLPQEPPATAAPAPALKEARQGPAGPRGATGPAPPPAQRPEGARPFSRQDEVLRGRFGAGAQSRSKAETRAPLAQELRRQPNRTVWPAAWGTLPERGFQLPGTGVQLQQAAPPPAESQVIRQQAAPAPRAPTAEKARKRR